ncbi:MAG: hypothetical protein IPG07_13155 [Crocinitomicaceae bacterium]|nr:hypothetical protein [Crocinitomicaceae bacterium]
MKRILLKLTTFCTLMTGLTSTLFSQTWQNVGSSGFSAGATTYTSIAFSTSGEPHVSYIDAENDDKVTVMKFNGTAWENVGVAGFSQGVAQYCSSIKFSSAGEPYVAFRDAANSYKATVMKFDGTAWANVGPAGFSAGDAT